MSQTPNSSPSTPGLILLCDRQGIVKAIQHDSLGISQNITVGRSITQMVEAANLEKMLNFLAELRSREAAFEWELNVVIANSVTHLHFTGLKNDEGLLVMCSDTGQGIQELYNDVMRMSNQQLTTLRLSMKAQSQAGCEPAPDVYDELTRLNNEMANLQRELVKKNAELERLNEQKNQFLGMASHDLRSPLAVIISYSDFLLDDAGAKLSDEEVEHLAIIQSSSNFMLELIDDLLDATAIESGKLELSPEPVNLVDLVENNVHLNAVLAARKKTELSLEAPAQPLPVEVDRNKIEQVLNNLISNAIKFSQAGSQIIVKLVETDGEARASVIDEGQGIPSDELADLFEPFSKTSVRGTEGEKSTGLGLMIARKVVEAHNGRIGVESTEGEGSTFHFTLPLVKNVQLDENVADAKTTPPEGKPTCRPLKILIAEDNRISQKVMAALLERVGYEADIVADGQATCEAVQNRNYDVILMDRHMPKIDGLEVTRFIRQQPWSGDRQPHIIAITASDRQEDIDACLAAGMDDFLSKPVKLDALCRKLSQIE